MRFLILNNTPAHVHLYRNAIDELQNRGHSVKVLARDYACTTDLLEYYDLPYAVYGRKGTTRTSLAAGLPRQFSSILREARRFDPDLIFGRGAYAAWASVVTGRPTVLVMDSVPWSAGVKLPAMVAEYVVTTNAFGYDLGPHHYRLHGLTECAYLGPDAYEPDPSVRADLDVGRDEPYALVRYNAFDAFHDVGERGFTRRQQRELIRRLAEHLTVFVSDENGALDLSSLPAAEYDLHPARIHDAMAESRLFVADTGTMVTEAALLGTPAVRATRDPENDLGEFVELHENGLLRNVRPERAVEEATTIAADPDAAERWRERRNEFVAERADPTALLVDIAEDPHAVPRLLG